MSEENYYMWLSRIKGIGLKKQELLLDKFGSPKDVFKASEKDLQNIIGINLQNFYNIRKHQNELLLDSYSKELKDKDIKFISKFGSNYPKLLKEIQNPPTGIYLKGELPEDSTIKISIIGSRKCTEYGTSVAYGLSKELAENGVVIVSGMARGIDSMAHRGALEAKGLTIAVLGCGIDICYPPENENLRDKIIKNGCLISEYPPGVKVLPVYFPARNRIISGLSLAVIVAEAGSKSGTLITVGQALEQGRDVYAVPGNINRKLSEGTNELIKQGASIVMSAEDILNDLKIEKTDSKNENLQSVVLTKEEAVVYNCINSEPISLEYIVDKCKVQVQDASYLLFLLELKGIVKKLPGQRYIRI